jgi:hypothetical protein
MSTENSISFCAPFTWISLVETCARGTAAEKKR